MLLQTQLYYHHYHHSEAVKSLCYSDVCVGVVQCCVSKAVTELLDCIYATRELR